MSSLTLLGPQVREPNLATALAAARLEGPFVSITAGWQEREGELDALREHLGCEVTDLGVYARTEAAFAADAELRAAHRERQALLQEMQELYALQLSHAKNAARELFARGPVERPRNALLRAARRRAIAALRRLDHAHLASVRRVHAQFDARFGPTTRPSVRAVLRELLERLERSRVVLIAGGHVAALLNRLRLLGAHEWLRGRSIVAWSAGAMALCESVVLFHDRPPQGAANAELFDAGLGFARGLVALPHAQRRLELHDAARVALLSRRFAPSACVALDTGACLHFVDGRLSLRAATFQLARSGALAEFDSAR